MKCSSCLQDIWTIAIEWDNSWAMYCVNCLNNKAAKDEVVYFKWKYYERTHPDIRRCDSCSCLIHKDEYIWNRGYCLWCMMKYRSATYCPQCWICHDWVCNGWLTDNSPVRDGRLNFTVRRESKSWSARGEAVENNTYIKSIWQYQTERETPSDIKEMLRKFYYWSKVFSHYYTREPINITGIVKYNNTQILSSVMRTLTRERDSIRGKVDEWLKISRYRNYYLQWIDDEWLIKWKFIDTMWNIRERSESINKFFDDFKLEQTNSQIAWEFKYVLSSDLMHKVKAFKLNEKVHSCQKSSNSDSYAKGAYDAITNGCNCPILIYNKWGREPFARITTRILYDKEGQEYILIDRLYHSWQFQDALMKWEVYKSIVKDLKDKWYKVIASNYSAHDESTYAYLASLWMHSDKIITDLCQPLRRLVNGCGYYCDGWTVVRQGTVDDIVRATDYLDKAYLL